MRPLVDGVVRIEFVLLYSIFINHILNDKYGYNLLCSSVKTQLDHTIIPIELLYLSIWIAISTGNISGLSFVGTMVAHLSHDLEKHYKAQIPYILTEMTSVKIEVLDEKATPKENASQANRETLTTLTK